MSAFVNLGGTFVRLSQVEVFERKQVMLGDGWADPVRPVEGKFFLEINTVGGDQYEIDDDSGELFEKLQRAIERFTGQVA